jgi:hypothetical protein
MKKRLATAGLGIGLLAGSGAGLAWQVAGGSASAVTDTTAPADTGDTTDTTDTGDTGDSARQPGDRLRETLAPLVENGTITQAQLDSVVETIVAARPEGGFGEGRGGRGGRGGRHLTVVADTIGLEIADVRAAIVGGQTIAELAVANGSTAQAVIDAIVADKTARINERVAAGELTQAEADAKLAELTERVTTFVNETPQFDGHHD